MLLEVKNVDSGYGDVQVLSNVSIHVDAGEIVSIVGANGAGKTTLIRTIMGTLPTKKGEIHFNGQRIDGQEPHMIARSGMAQVMEGRRLFGHMEVEDNLLVGGDILHDKVRQRENLEWIYSMFPRLKERRRNGGTQLSGGEQQMLSIARAVVTRPGILLLDEPLEGLAPKVRQEVMESITRMASELGVGCVLVEQYVDVVLSFCEHVVVLESGQVVYAGRTDTLRQQHADVLENAIGLRKI